MLNYEDLANTFVNLYEQGTDGPMRAAAWAEVTLGWDELKNLQQPVHDEFIKRGYTF